MKALSETGKQKVHDIAIKYGLKLETVNGLLQAIIYGHGTQAQFNLPELGGMGQWMKGGMIMVGDMFNNSLKNTVDNICTELAHLLSKEENFQENVIEGKREFFGSGTWWPSEYGNPSTSGSQNNMRYAYFSAPVNRLVIETNGKRSIYDTMTYHISGVSQQQGTSQSITFTSQQGPVNIQSLPLISEPDQQNNEENKAYANAKESKGGTNTDIHNVPDRDDVFTSIEKLGVLLERNLISREEFEAKKAELLKKL